MQEHEESKSICNEKRGCPCKELNGRCTLKKLDEISTEIYKKYSDDVRRELIKFYTEEENASK